MYRKNLMLLALFLITLIGCSKKDKTEVPNLKPATSLVAS